MKPSRLTDMICEENWKSDGKERLRGQRIVQTLVVFSLLRFLETSGKELDSPTSRDVS